MDSTRRGPAAAPCDEHGGATVQHTQRHPREQGAIMHHIVLDGIPVVPPSQRAAQARSSPASAPALDQNGHPDCILTRCHLAVESGRRLGPGAATGSEVRIRPDPPMSYSCLEQPAPLMAGTCL